MTGESVLSRVVRILEAFDPENPALRLSVVARRSDLHIATASRLVNEMVGLGLLARDPDRRIRIGVRLWELASRTSPTLGLREAAMPFLEDLHDVVGHHTQLAVLGGREALFVERLSAPGGIVNITRIAGRLPLHASSGGLVLLAHADPDLQEEILAGALTRYTPQTPHSAQQVRVLLAEIRRTGYVFCPGYIDPAAAGIAAPIRDGTGQVVAALGAVLPNDAHARAQISAVRAAARGVSRALGQAL
ncbi:IclR family transcriptional regulator [Actinocorallia longicatena]|uniref:IclR family transcriptional regulator n=1 Tax=Actinocorallia longicatena TaxID=111803 RepID=A0ABP6PXT5_9ACTN